MFMVGPGLGPQMRQPISRFVILFEPPGLQGVFLMYKMVEVMVFWEKFHP